MNQPKPEKNKFFVDNKPYDTDKTALTGAEIKAQASVPAAYQLFLEVHGDGADKPISDGESVDVGEKPPKHLYAVPPATFG